MVQPMSKESHQPSNPLPTTISPTAPRTVLPPKPVKRTTVSFTIGLRDGRQITLILSMRATIRCSRGGGSLSRLICAHLLTTGFSGNCPLIVNTEQWAQGKSLLQLNVWVSHPNGWIISAARGWRRHRYLPITWLNTLRSASTLRGTRSYVSLSSVDFLSVVRENGGPYLQRASWPSSPNGSFLADLRALTNHI